MARRRRYREPGSGLHTVSSFRAGKLRALYRKLAPSFTNNDASEVHHDANAANGHNAWSDAEHQGVPADDDGAISIHHLYLGQFSSWIVKSLLVILNEAILERWIEIPHSKL